VNEPVRARCDYVGCTEHPTRIFCEGVMSDGGSFDCRLILCGKHHGEEVERRRKEIEGELLTLTEAPC